MKPDRLPNEALEGASVAVAVDVVDLAADAEATAEAATATNPCQSKTPVREFLIFLEYVYHKLVMFKIPKNDAKYHWTQHVLRKMAFYGLTPDRVKRIIRTPSRIEEGIAEQTIGVMQLGPNKKKPTEIWAMYRTKPKSHQKIVISAWRYPGISPVGKQIPIPQDILEELKKENII